MAKRVLVLHGPNLNLLAEPGEDGPRTLEVLDAELEARATRLGFQLRIVQSSSEGGLLDALVGQRTWAQAVVVNPGALAPIAFALAEGLELLGKPSIEVLLENFPKGRGPSALTEVAAQQLHGRGADGYLEALEAMVKLLEREPGDADDAPEAEEEPEEAEEPPELATDEEEEADEEAPPPSKRTAQARAAKVPVREPARAAAPRSIGPKKARAVKVAAASAKGKTIGRQAQAKVEDGSARTGKTIGRREVGKGAPEKGRTEGKGAGLTRAQVRAKLADRLSGKMSPPDFASWARTQWLAVRGGAAVEPGQREVLEDVLLMLAASGRANDHVLLNYMAKLE